MVQIMAWRRPGDKPLPEPMMLVYRRIYASLGLDELLISNTHFNCRSATMDKPYTNIQPHKNDFFLWPSVVKNSCMISAITSGFIQGKHMPHMNSAAMGPADIPNVAVAIAKADLPADAIKIANAITVIPINTTEINWYIAGDHVAKNEKNKNQNITADYLLSAWFVITQRYSSRWPISWWCHQMETFSALLALCEENSPVPVDSPQRPVTRSFDVFFDLRLNKWLSKQSRRRWFETPSCPLWRHCHVIQLNQHWCNCNLIQLNQHWNSIDA